MFNTDFIQPSVLFLNLILVLFDFLIKATRNLVTYENSVTYSIRAACRYNYLVILALVERWNLRTSKNVVNSMINLQQNYFPFGVGTF